MKRVAILAIAFFAAFCSRGQNVVVRSEGTKTAPPVSITVAQARECISNCADFSGEPKAAEAKRIRAKLNRHVAEYLAGAPWMPFHHTLGISGYEVYFDHPDELFYSLSIAFPFLTPENQAKTKTHLTRLLNDFPPYAVNGFDRRAGRPRESYQVPKSLRLRDAGQARSAIGVYAFWAYCQYVSAHNEAKRRWPEIKARVQPLLIEPYHFDPARTNSSRDEAQILNGDLAGLIGFARIARWNDEPEREKDAVDTVRRLLELRVNLDRINPRILEKATASKNLHANKLTRYCSLVPELAAAVARWTDGCAAANLQDFRAARNGWHIAFGDRLIGGENYTNPLHFPRALFAGATFIEQLPAEDLFRFIDVPWCKGDLYFIEKCASALWADVGRKWNSEE